MAYADVMSSLAIVEERLGRQVNPSIYSSKDLARRLREGKTLCHPCSGSAKNLVEEVVEVFTCRQQSIYLGESRLVDEVTEENKIRSIKTKAPL